MCYMPRDASASGGIGRRRVAAAAGRRGTLAREATAARDRQVQVRELRQNLSVYLDRVVAGETLEVTSRGRPVAVLAPLPQPATLTARLVAAGRATAATRKPADLTPIRRLRPSTLGRRLQRAIDQARGDAV